MLVRVELNIMNTTIALAAYQFKRSTQSAFSFVAASSRAANFGLRCFIVAFLTTYLGLGPVAIMASTLPSEYVTSFPPVTPPPDPTSAVYTQVTEQTNAIAVPFNNATQQTRNIVINANQVVFDDSDPAGLWQRLNGATDVGQLTINASNVTIMSDLYLPGATVIINSATLAFRPNPAHGGTDNAALETTPAAAAPATAIGQNGSAGQNAGNITLIIGTFFSASTKTNRFISHGGRGGDPGPGANGIDGISLAVPNDLGQPSQANNQEGLPDWCAVWIDYRVVQCSKCDPSHVAYYGTEAYPTSGTSATSAGKPGNPGAAGTLTTTVDVSAYADLAGGMSGTQGTNYSGGHAGTPTTSYHAEVDDNSHGRYWHMLAGGSFVYTQDGTNATSPPADIPVGTNGVQVISGSTNMWMTAKYSEIALTFAKDAYKAEDYVLAQSALVGLVNNISNATNSADGPELSEIQGEAQTLLHRLAAGLTYYGWPINYAPLLSLQITEAAFDSDIERLAYPVYLDQVINSANRSITDKLAAVQQSKQNLLTDINTQTSLINSTLATIPPMQNQATQLNQQIAQLQANVQEIATVQLQQAQADVANTHLQQQVPIWQTALRVISAVADFTPYAAPVNGIVNGTLTVANDINSIDQNSPWQDISQVPGLTTALSTMFSSAQPTNFVSASTTLANQLSGLNLTTVTNWGAYLTNLQAITAPIKTGVSAVQTLLGTNTISSSDVQAQLAKIQSTDPILANNAAQLNSIMQQKQALAQSAATAIQTISTACDRIQSDILAISACDDQLDSGALVLSDELVSRLDVIAADALDDIEKYQALTAAAYRYQTLQQYPGNLNLTSLISEIQQLAQTSPVQLNPSDFAPVVTLYKTDLSAIANNIVDYFENNFAPLQSRVFYDLDQNTINQLNTDGGPVHINLSRLGIFPPSQQNIRLVAINFTNINAVIPTGFQIHQIATLTITLQHSGTSTIANNGYLYQFFHYPDDAQNPVVWSTVVDLKHGLTFPSEPSPLIGSLIGALVGLPNATIEDTFADLGADSDMELTVQAYSDNGIPIQLNGLTLDIQYVYQNQQSHVSSVEVLGVGGAEPQIAIDTPDIASRTNGVVPFLRYYRNDEVSTIHLTAPATLEDMSFAYWADQFGNKLPSSDTNATTLTLSVTSSKVVVPVYQLPMGAINMTVQNGTPVITWDALPGVVYQLQTSTNLSQWTNLGGTLTMSEFQFQGMMQDRGQLEGQRFYRVVLLGNP